MTNPVSCRSRTTNRVWCRNRASRSPSTSVTWTTPTSTNRCRNLVTDRDGATPTRPAPAAKTKPGRKASRPRIHPPRPNA
ncbi:hypothetical protein OPAG_09367, partial [Rhodococcus opacus PD630]